jgi:hypothetical protein
MAALGWALSGMDVERAGEWANIVEAFAALLAVPGLAFAALALRSPGTAGEAPREPVSQSVVMGPVTAGRDVNQHVHQHVRQPTGGDAGQVADWGTDRSDDAIRER